MITRDRTLKKKQPNLPRRKKGDLTPSECIDIFTVVPIPVNLVLFQDIPDLDQFFLIQRDVYRGDVFQDP